MSVANQRQVFRFKLCSFGINLVTFAKFVVKMISVASNIKKAGSQGYVGLRKSAFEIILATRNFFLNFNSKNVC